MTIHVIRPGPMTTVQDLGRWGFQRYGVIVGGAMDPAALEIANRLVGNQEHCAALEMALIGPTLEFAEAAIIAIFGADMPLAIDDQPCPLQRPVFVPAGSTMALGAASRGCYAYLAVAGGINVPVVLGSRSTHVRSSVGGFEGRPLAAGDRIDVGQTSRPLQHRMRQFGSMNRPRVVSTRWFIPSRLPAKEDVVVVRVITGAQYEWLEPASQAALFERPFAITNNSDRMGYRLSGTGLTLTTTNELLSEGACTGTVQLPADGQLIVLMADCATTGGYAKVAHVASVDLPLLAQTPPGHAIRFERITIEQSQQLYRAHRAEMRQLEFAIDSKLEDWEMC